MWQRPGGIDSDIDVLVTFAPDAKWSLFDHVDMEGELQQILGRPVDLVSRRGSRGAGTRSGEKRSWSPPGSFHAA
jgi:predicted nucleotidyltransferase